jgi:thiol-disulfide isomerase/thioredoxin
VAAALVSGWGGGAGGTGRHPYYATALAGSRPALAALHRQANELLPGGADALDRRLRSLRGRPVVVNAWASWCGPCRLEFPIFQRVSAAYGKRVAFIGIDSQDSDAHAESFLGENPVPYPSYSDPDGGMADDLGGIGLPKTAFYDRDGELVYLDLRPYTEDAALRANVERYALGGG